MEKENDYKVIDIMMTEYSELRQEIRSIMDKQTTITAFTVSALGVIFGVVANAAGTYGISSDISQLLFFVMIILIPSMSYLFCTTWFDKVYRQVRLGVYVSIIEKKINHMLNLASDVRHAALYWEQWIAIDRSPKNLFLRINYFYFFINIGLYISIPIISIIFFLENVQLESMKWTIYMTLLSVLVIIFTIIFIIMCMKYCIEILQLSKIIEKGAKSN